MTIWNVGDLWGTRFSTFLLGRVFKLERYISSNIVEYLESGTIIYHIYMYVRMYTTYYSNMY